MTPLKFGITADQAIQAVSALENVDLHPRTLLRYALSGLVTPSVKWPRKRGRYNGRLYSLADIHRLRLVARLQKHGFSLNRIRVVLAFVHEQLEDALKPRTTARLIVASGDRAWIERDGAPSVAVPSGQLMLPLADVVTDEAKIRKVIAA